MHTFTDTDRRLWKVRLSIPVMDRVRDETGVDIGVWDNLQVVNMSAIDLTNVLWVMVAPQAKKMRVTRDTFRAAVSGAALHDAQKAFIDEFLLFVPRDRQRALTRAIAFQQREAEIERVESARQETLATTRCCYYLRRPWRHPATMLPSCRHLWSRRAQVQSPRARVDGGE